MRRQCGSKQCLCVWVQRVRAELAAFRYLNKLTKIHHRNAMTDMGHGGEIMADEQVTDAQSRLKMLQLAHNLRPDGHIQG